MRTYRDKEDLKNEIRQSFEKYISEFDTIPEALAVAVHYAEEYLAENR